jgi:hypothetical protein
MWNQGKSALNMNVDTGVARARAEKVMDAAARSGAALPLHQEWRPKVDTSDPKSRWIVEGTKVDPSANDPLASHLDLELAVGRPPSAMELAAGGDASDSSEYGESSDSESSRKKSKKRSRDRGDDEKDKTSKKRKKESRKKKSKSKKESKKSKKGSKKSKKSRRSSSSSSSDGSDSDASDSDSEKKRISAVSGKKIKLRLEGTSARTDAEDKRRQAYLRSLNAHVDMSHLTGR